MKKLLVVLGPIIVGAALVDVTVTGPRVAVRWAPHVDAAARLALQQRYQLRNGRQNEGPEWRYELRDWSRANVRALVRDPAVADTAYINRTAFTAERPDLRVALRFPFSSDPGFPGVWHLFQLQSLCLLLVGGSLLLAARIRHEPLRRGAAAALLLLTAMTAFALPFEQARLRMGDAATYTASRQAFESYVGVTHIRFEAHLSHAILGRLYDLLGRTAEAPNRAFDLLMRGGTAWFLGSALVIGFIERWSPLVVRYLGLALLAPSALLYFGYRELGHLSLNVAAFPLLARGLHHGSNRLEAGSLLFGLGAALHGFGLLSLAGSWIAAFAARAPLAERARLALRIAVWGTAAYLGWVAVYAVLLKLPIVPGHVESIPWRPWLVDQVIPEDDRINAAILSVVGGRDLLFTGWVVGAPLLAVAVSLWRRYRDEVRVALCYAAPSTVFTIVFWPIQGLGVEMDLVIAAFPALYALAWVCAHDARRTLLAAALLVSGHLAFWRIVLDARFVN
jgi:hypothetical protein